MAPPDKRILKAYGDRQGDGMLQMSFVLELAPSPIAREAAKKFAEAHGLRDPLVATMEACADGYSYFVVYGQSTHAVDMSQIHVPELATEALTRDEIEERVKKTLGRKIVVVGACTGSDAHTVGIDAILISQVITQRNCHKENANAFVEIAKKQGFRDNMILLLGGPRIDHQLALELGFDAGFGPGTKPIDVASLLVSRIVK